MRSTPMWWISEMKVYIEIILLQSTSLSITKNNILRHSPRLNKAKIFLRKFWYANESIFKIPFSFAPIAGGKKCFLRFNRNFQNIKHATYQGKSYHKEEVKIPSVSFFNI